MHGKVSAFIAMAGRRLMSHKVRRAWGDRSLHDSRCSRLRTRAANREAKRWPEGVMPLSSEAKNQLMGNPKD
ncbi:hypothetical protein BTI_3688 [Burkholderia thailandensis MSMB121]|nr:hypothetical protein BTI_3688 [Burkholderia thailandensis MSMB121]AJY38534.1 hypothetical protein BW21_5688 [Burkholderia sp. 2002721687]